MIFSNLIYSQNSYTLDKMHARLSITLHGVTKPIAFDVVYHGKAQSPFNQKYSYGFTITGKLKRSDFGVGSEAVATVADEVALKSNVEFVAN